MSAVFKGLGAQRSLGKDVLLAGDVNADSFFVLQPQNGQMKALTLRVPYPLGFHPRHVAGRIDDPNAGWKGRGVWSSYSMYTPWQDERRCMTASCC